ncbi:preprotein translocase subunit SecG [Candidatus Roizmanbacteria bacterium]|nr:preprotein translocase subunit SecG [Candidatus Roizmanbacteria bacterium]
MKNILLLVNIVLSVAIVIFILVQGRGAGLGSAWGGGGERFQTRRGIEKAVLLLTGIAVFIFLIVSLVNLFVK